MISASRLPHQVCEDSNDDKFLACAVTGDANFIISGDKHLLKIREYHGIEVIKPRNFVEQYLRTI